MMDFEQSYKYLENLKTVLNDIREENKQFLKLPIIMSVLMLIVLTMAIKNTS